MSDAASVEAGCEFSQKVFGTALFGFKRDDVLSYVETLNKQSTQASTALKNSIEALENNLSQTRQDSAALRDANGELTENLNAASLRAQEAESAVSSLRLELDKINDEAAAYKSRLFTREQENVVLKADNARLNSNIMSLTAIVNEYEARRDAIAKQEITVQSEIEELKKNARGEAEVIKAQARREAATISNDAAVQVRAMRDNASNEAVALVAAAEKEKNAAKLVINGSAENIAQSVTTIKTELSQLDARIAGALSELSRITNGITDAISQTEKGLETLGVQVSVFPEPSAPISKPQQKEPHRAPRPKRPTASDNILDKLTRLLKSN